MQINDYQDLTSFVGQEYEKMQDSFNVVTPSKTFIKTLEANCLKYYKLYDKPFFKREKMELKIEEAIYTMPHGKIWQFFHKRLWLKVQERLAEMEKAEKELKQVYAPPQQKPLIPEIYKPVDVPKIADLEAGQG